LGSIALFRSLSPPLFLYVLPHKKEMHRIRNSCDVDVRLRHLSTTHADKLRSITMNSSHDWNSVRGENEESHLKLK
jgi:hypothetical protein